MMKKYFSFLAVCALLFALALTAYAEPESDDYAKTFENELFSAFDSETKAAMELFGIESELLSEVQQIQTAALEGDFNSVIALSKRAQSTLFERNRLCKLGK